MGLMDTLRGSGTGGLRRKQKKLLQQERESDRMYGDATLESIRRGQEAAVGGYDQAISKTSTISRAARRDAISRAEELGGTLTARFGAGGKFGTTALDQARMGLASSLTRDLEGIDSGFADLFGQLSVGRGQAQAAGESDIAQFQQLRGGQESEILRLLAGTLKQPRPGVLSGILGAGGSALGSIFGGPVGGALGGEVGSAVGGAFERD